MKVDVIIRKLDLLKMQFYFLPRLKSNYILNSLYKAEVICKDDPWRGWESVERETLTWVDWFNNERILKAIGDIAPAEYELM